MIFTFFNSFSNDFTQLVNYTLQNTFEKLDSILYDTYDRKSKDSNAETNTFVIALAKLIPIFENISQGLCDGNNELLEFTLLDHKIDDFTRGVYMANMPQNETNK